jgi:hypothetical protein
VRHTGDRYVVRRFEDPTDPFDDDRMVVDQ